MKIIKRNGSEVAFDLSKIENAIIDKNNTIRLMNYENVVTEEAPKPGL